MSFKPTGVFANAEIEYVEIEHTADLLTTEVAVGTGVSVSDAKRQASPVVGMPIRK
jgi:hypothetical protein